MRHVLSIRWSLVLISCLALSACETNPSAKSAQDDATPIVAFLDADKFDHQLSASLSAPMNEITVPFYDKVSPNNMPERMKAWVNQVEKSGGKIQMTEPTSSSGVTAKNPFLIFSMINAIRTLVQLEQRSEKAKVLASAKGHDVKILLAYNAQNEVVIDKIVFAKKGAAK
jgi:hypothetical protein